MRLHLPYDSFVSVYFNYSDVSITCVWTRMAECHGRRELRIAEMEFHSILFPCQSHLGPLMILNEITFFFLLCLFSILLNKFTHLFQ